MIPDTRLALISSLIVVTMASSGCHDKVTTHEPAASAFARLEAAPVAGDVIAKVGEREISRAELESFWRQHPELDRAQALDAIIDRQLLSVVAAERYADGDEALDYARKRGLVDALLTSKIELSETTEVADHERAQIEAKVLAEARKLEGYRASHLLVMIPEQADEASWEKGLGVIESQRALALQRPGLDGLYLAREQSGGEVEGFKIIINASLMFPAPGENVARSQLPAGWLDVVAPFKEATAKLIAEEGVGSLSAPVRTKFGWHIILAEEHIKGTALVGEALEEATQEMAEEVSAQRRLAKLLGQLLKDRSYFTVPETLEEDELMASKSAAE